MGVLGGGGGGGREGGREGGRGKRGEKVKMKGGRLISWTCKLTKGGHT